VAHDDQAGDGEGDTQANEQDALEEGARHVVLLTSKRSAPVLEGAEPQEMLRGSPPASLSPAPTIGDLNGYNFYV
jgi:hypothetical protein